MNPSPERLRKIYGIKEPKGPADPATLARNKYHEAAARWFDRWSVSLQALFALIGFLFVLLPTMIKNWQVIVEKTPVAGQIFRDFSSFSGSAMILLCLWMATFLVRSSLIKSLPESEARCLPYSEIAEMELYPRNRKEEIAFWVDFIFTTMGTAAWIFLPFGSIAYFIRIGG